MYVSVIFTVAAECGHYFYTPCSWHRSISASETLPGFAVGLSTSSRRGGFRVVSLEMGLNGALATHWHVFGAGPLKAWECLSQLGLKKICDRES